MPDLPFKANTEGNDEGLDDYTPIPAGTVIASIKKSQYLETKAKTGNYLQLQWSVMQGKYKGRTLFDNLNLDNPNPIAVEIANKTLNSICKACNKVGVEKSEELHGIPVELTISVTKATDTQPASNNIKGYKNVSGDMAETASEPAEVPAEAENTTETAKKKLPWEK